jgi:NAD(P)-dependent dehydrogenase (short-subunit alcohol dehydrogenase family)
LDQRWGRIDVVAAMTRAWAAEFSQSSVRVNAIAQARSTPQSPLDEQLDRCDQRHHERRGAGRIG